MKQGGIEVDGAILAPDLLSPPGPLSSSHHSSLVEAILEYRLLGDLGAALARRGIAMEVMRCDVDHAGYDLVLEARGIIRHVQLKAMHADGKRADVTVNVALSNKPSGCVVWMLYDPLAYAITGYRWFGGAPGAPLPDTGDRLARHSKGNADGVKSARPAHRVIRAGAFTSLASIEALTARLFGIVDPDAALLETLEAGHRDWRLIARDAAARARCPDSSSDLAHVIDGHRLLTDLGHADHDAWLAARQRSAERTGSWCGTLSDHWIALFLLHRRWRLAGTGPSTGEAVLHDRLLAQLKRALAQYTG